MTVTVSVRPASSSFFAGEQFLCYITFTNTAKPQAPLHAELNAGSLAQEQERRTPSLSAASVSEDGRFPESAPSENGTVTETASVPGNGSVIVHQQEPSSDAVKEAALSLSTSAGALPARKPSTPIGRAHPHSRKMSIRNDFHLAFPDEPSYRNPSPAPSVSSLADSAVSVAAPSTPRRASASPLFPSSAAASSMSSLGSLVDNTSPRRASLNSSELRNRVAQSPGSVHILWSFAQLSGSFQLDESIIKPTEFNALKQRLVDRSSSTSAGGGFGGGGLGHDVQLDVDERVGWGAYLKNALTSPVSPGLKNFGLNSPSHAHDWTAPSTPRGPSRHMPSASLALPSTLSASNGATSASPNIGPSSPSVSRRRVSHKHTGSTLQDNRERTLMNRNIPTLSTPPSILFVDHVLAPGESKTYSFRLPLPLDLPPSFLGRSIQFTYNLTIGVNRSPDASGPQLSYPNGPSNTRSKLFTIPIRLYNNVALPHGEPAFWDLGNPVIKGRDDGVVTHEPAGPPSTLASGDSESLVSLPALPDTPLSETKGSSLGLKSGSGAGLEKNMLELQNIARALLGLPEEDETAGPDSSSAKSATLQRPNLALRRSSSSADGPQAEEAETHTCASATDILATNSPKVSYDISKDGSITAVLTLVRSRYRLGDTVQGVVSMNAKGALTRIVRVAVTLESHEDIEPSLSVITPVHKAIKATRIVHAEHHESTLDKARVPFSLSIPSGATPDFKTSAVKLKWTVKLSLLTLASVKHPSPNGETLQPTTPVLGQTPSTPGSTVSSAPSTPGGGEPLSPFPNPMNGHHLPVPAARLPPPPHLMPSKPDGFALYHSAWRAVKHLAGPGVANAGNPTMLAPVTLRRSRERDETVVPADQVAAESQTEDKTQANGEEDNADHTAPVAPANAQGGGELPTIENTPAIQHSQDSDTLTLEDLKAELPETPPHVPFASETRLEIVECAVPVRILPSTTNFAVGNFVFEA